LALVYLAPEHRFTAALGEAISPSQPLRLNRRNPRANVILG
jgi:hypothetical protein